LSVFTGLSEIDVVVLITTPVPVSNVVWDVVEVSSDFADVGSKPVAKTWIPPGTAMP